MLSITRQQQLIQSLNTQGQKVFASVPITEAWSITKIISDLHRLGVTMDKSAVHGSLAHMVKSGLIDEVLVNTYQRTPLRYPQPRPHVSEENTETNKGTVMGEALQRATVSINTDAIRRRNETKLPTMDALAQVAADLRSQAKDLEAEADRIEEIALQIASEQQAGSKEMAEVLRVREAVKTLLGN